MSIAFVEIRDANGELLPKFSTLAFDTKYRDYGAIEFSYPLDLAKAAGLTDQSSVSVVVGYTDGSSRTVERYVITSTGDTKVVDGTRMRDFTGKSSLFYMEDAAVYPENWPVTVPPGHEFVNVSAGTILRTLITKAQARGTLAGIDATSFTGLVDSNGNAWATTISQTYANGTKYSTIIQDLWQRGIIDVELTPTNQLKVYNGNALGSHIAAGTLMVAPSRNVTEVSTETDSNESCSVVLMEGEEGTVVERTSSSGFAAVGRRRERYAQQGGIADLGVLTILADAELDLYAKITTEETVGVIDHDGLEAFKDFDAADWIWVRYDGDDDPVERRVYQVAVAVDENRSLTVGLTLNSIIYENDIKTQRQIDAYTGGGGVYSGGPSDVPPEDDVAPNPPSGPAITTASYADAQGNPVGVMSLAWVAPTTSTDGSSLTDLDHYVVQWRYTSGQTPTTYATNYTVDASLTTWGYSPVTAGATVRARVKAVDTSGNESTWAEAAAVLVPKDSTPPNQPSTPTLTARLGTVTITWDGKDSTGAAMPPDFKHVRVEVSSTVGFASPTVVGFMTGAGYVVAANLTYGASTYARLVAVDLDGNASSASTVAGPATVVALVNTDIIGQQILNAAIVDGTITASSKVFSQSVVSANIASLNITTGLLAANAATFDKIDVGSLYGQTFTGLVLQTDPAFNVGVKMNSSAGIEVYGGGTLRFQATPAGNVNIYGGTFKSVNVSGMGARVEMNSTGFYAYNGSSQTFAVTSSGGSGTFSGIVQAGQITTIGQSGNYMTLGFGSQPELAFLNGSSQVLGKLARYGSVGSGSVELTSSGGNGIQIPDSGAVYVSVGMTVSGAFQANGITVASGSNIFMSGAGTINLNSGTLSTGTSGTIAMGASATITGGGTWNGGPTINNATLNTPTIVRAATGGTADVNWNSGNIRSTGSLEAQKENIRPLEKELTAKQILSIDPYAYHRIGEPEPTEFGVVVERIMKSKHGKALDPMILRFDDGSPRTFDYFKLAVLHQVVLRDFDARLTKAGL